MIDPDYPRGGKPIMAPYAGPRADSLKFQSEVIADMKAEAEGTLTPRTFRDYGTGRDLTRAQYFDEHARCLLVIAEVEARCNVEACSKAAPRSTTA